MSSHRLLVPKIGQPSSKKCVSSTTSWAEDDVSPSPRISPCILDISTMLKNTTQLTERISDCIAGDQSRTHQFTTTEEKPFLLQLRVQVDRLLKWKSYNLDLISFIAYKLYSHIIASISNNNCTWFWVVLSAGSFCGRSIF